MRPNIESSVIQDNENGVCFIDRKSCAVERIDVAIDTSISSDRSIFIQIIRSTIDRHGNG